MTLGTQEGHRASEPIKKLVVTQYWKCRSLTRFLAADSISDKTVLLSLFPGALREFMITALTEGKDKESARHDSQ